MINILMIISLVLAGYAILSFVLPYKTKWYVKLGWSLFFLAISQKFTFYYYVGGHMFNPQLPETTLIIWETLFNIILVLVPLRKPRAEFHHTLAIDCSEQPLAYNDFFSGSGYVRYTRCAACSYCQSRSDHS